jgi:tetratricopeptide (TPR) repeat protein
MLAAAVLALATMLLLSAAPATDLLRQGIAAFERGDAAAAETLFRQALAADPADGAAHAYLGALADRAGRLAEAERHFAAAVSAEPRSAAARNNHGGILLRMGRRVEAAAAFEEALRLGGDAPALLVNLAQLRLSDGTDDGLRAARTLFERAQALAPDAEIARASTLTALRLGDLGQARTLFRDYTARVADAGPAVAGTAPRTELGAALLASGLAVEAAEELGAVVAADPAASEAVVLKARAHAAAGDEGAAARTLDAALVRGLDTAVIYSALADRHESAGDLDRAIPAWRRALERDPANESYHFRYAMLLVRAKAPSAAVIRLGEALARAPGSARLWFALGLARLSDQKNDDAARAFDRASQLDPRFAPALAYRGLTDAAAGRYDEALSFYDRALAVDDRLAATHYLAGDALAKKTTPDLSRAERHLRRAIALDPAFTPAGLSLGRLYLQTGRAAEAAAEFERVRAREPNLAQTHYQLGRTYLRLNRKTEGEAALATFKRLSEQDRAQAVSERQDLLRRLADVRF